MVMINDNKSMIIINDYIPSGKDFIKADRLYVTLPVLVVRVGRTYRVVKAGPRLRGEQTKVIAEIRLSATSTGVCGDNLEMKE